jgi:CPA1 family monovalent cation:H+ antiporter
MLWGGLRGAISLALALSLPESFGSDRVSLQMMVFGVVLFTLLVQSLSMEPFIRRLNIIEKSETRRLYEHARAQAAAAKVGLSQLKAMLAAGHISEYVFDIIEAQTTDTARLLKEAVQKSVSADSEIAAFERDAAWGEMLRAQRIELQNLLTAGLISEEIYRELVQVVDASFENPPYLPETERQKGNSHHADTKDAKE